jgi:hypothetical protein
MSIQSNPVEKDWKKPRYSLTTNLWYDEAMPKLPQWTKKDLHDFIVANPREGEQFAWLSWRNRIKVSCLSLAVTVTRCATRKKKTTRATCDFFFFFFFFFFFSTLRLQQMYATFAAGTAFAAVGLVRKRHPAYAVVGFTFGSEWLLFLCYCVGALLTHAFQSN